jgi:hypothetical protein
LWSREVIGLKNIKASERGRREEGKQGAPGLRTLPNHKESQPVQPE